MCTDKIGLGPSDPTGNGQAPADRQRPDPMLSHTSGERVRPDWPLTMHLQPVVDLDSGAVIGFEALARDVRSGSPEAPVRLFDEAGRQGRLVDLDWACRTRAITTALASPVAGTAGSALFVNVEPASAG